MKSSRALLLVSVVLTLTACSRSSSSDPGSSTPGGGQPNVTTDSDSNSVAQEGLFSFPAPKGWQVQEAPDSDYPVCVGPAEAGGYTPHLQASSHDYGSIDDYIKSSTKPQDGIHLTDNSAFTTNAGDKGRRLIIQNDNGAHEEAVVYIFKGKAGLLLVFTGNCLSAADASIRPLFDESMKNLQLDKG